MGVGGRPLSGGAPGEASAAPRTDGGRKIEVDAAFSGRIRGTPRRRFVAMPRWVLILAVVTAPAPGCARAGSAAGEAEGAVPESQPARPGEAAPAAAPAPAAPASDPAGLPASTEPACRATAGQQLLEVVNRVRRENGLPPLQVDLRLVQAAVAHSADMARRERLGHRGSDGREVQHRAERNGYDWLSIAENVAAGQPTVDDVMGSWMGSPGHRRNILHPEARHFGAAVARSREGIPFWTQVFGGTDRSPAPPEGGCHP